MDRRGVLTTLLGLGVAVTGGALLAAGGAQARIAQPGPLPVPEPAAAPAVASEDDVAAARIENVWHRGYPHRGWRWRRRRWREERRRRQWRRRRWWRRCWVNRRGYRVCRM